MPYKETDPCMARSMNSHDPSPCIGRLYVQALETNQAPTIRSENFTIADASNHDGHRTLTTNVPGTLKQAGSPEWENSLPKNQ
jgi:hypothetical protein